jgi:hypothetical protein
VFGAGADVTGVAGTSITGVGVYGQSGEDPNSLIPQIVPSPGVFAANNNGSGVVGWSANAQLWYVVLTQRRCGPIGHYNCHGLYVRHKSANKFEVREVMGGKSSIPFSYRIVGRRKDVKQRRRFAKVDMGLPLPTSPPRAPRKPVPTAADLRAFVARIEKEGRERLPKRPEKVRARSTKRPRPDFERLMQLLPGN